MNLPFLLEIGTEEIPDWMIPGALENLRSLFEEALAKASVSPQSVRVDGTPRRLTLRADGVPERQADSEDLITGPPKSAPAGAVAGFAKKQGIPVDALQLQSTPKGEYYGYIRKIEGRAVRQIVADALPELILKIYFPKTMYWTGKTGPRFIRPIRWIVALLGEEVVPFELAGVKSGNASGGHRVLGKASFPVTIAGYEAALQENGVLLSADARRAKICSEIAALHAHPRPDSSLEDTLVYLTEYPTAILGGFDPQFLALPKEVLITVMKHHQKYFSVEDGEGNLAPHFIAVMNTAADPDGLVRRGNERVLRARFNDARFFWNTDQRKKLADRLGDLANVTFQAKLGSYLAKTDRMKELAGQIGGDAHAIRAAELSKCDLTTELVKEFTELQGVIGGLYARAQGEPEEVAQAIYDHYKPVSMEDSIPSTRAGQLVSLADKLDTLRGCFAIGMIPTGSRDPFALRRAAQGVVKILVEGKLDLQLAELLNNDAQLMEFVLDRVRYYFKEIRGFKYDEVNAALAAGSNSLVDLENRLAAVQAVRPTENFEPLAASFKRIRNILLQAQFSGGGAVQPALLEPGPEADLHTDFERVRREAAGADYRRALETIASLRPKVDLFFDKVLVNAPDPKVRRNRLALLHAILTESSTIADFSEIVTNS
ncbi:MAG TPA: glycine--tRNA ligase subunit beta [Bryobacteraceae bacterium]|nr:glycine--tRNA ligase subunit beta [Bryobacteraceae bacterium]